MRLRAPRSVLLAAALLLGAALPAAAGCGDGGSSGDEAPALGKQEYEQQYAEAVAADAEALSGVLDQGPRQDPRATAATYERLARLGAAQAEHLAALRPPADIADEHGAYAELLARVAGLYADVAARIRARPDAATSAAQVKRVVELFGAPRNAQVVTDFTRAAEAGGYDLGIGLSEPAGERGAPDGP